jgi:hypothetical protein
MSWNYRVLAWEQEDEEPYFEIGSVSYDKHGNPVVYSEYGNIAGGDTIDELQVELNQMNQALNKPILWAGDKFPEEYKG